MGVKVGRQKYTYYAAGEDYSGENVYGILQAPRGDATEAIVLVAAWKSIDEQLNRNGVALALTLIRYFKRTWRHWFWSRLKLTFSLSCRMVLVVQGYYPLGAPRQSNWDAGLGRCLSRCS